LVLFRMLTGKLPFEANTVQETMIKRLTDEPTKLATARPDVVFPTGLQEVLATALTRSPVDRYQTVAKFAENVATVTGAGRPRAGPGGRSATHTVETPRPHAPRHPSTRRRPRTRWTTSSSSSWVRRRPAWCSTRPGGSTTPRRSAWRIARTPRS